MATMCATTSAAYVNEHLQAVMTGVGDPDADVDGNGYGDGGKDGYKGMQMDRASGKWNNTTKNGREFPNYAAATAWKRAFLVCLINTLNLNFRSSFI